MESKYFKYGVDFPPFVTDKRTGSLESYKPPTSFEYNLPRGLIGHESTTHFRKEKLYNIGGAVLQGNGTPNGRQQRDIDWKNRDTQFDNIIGSRRLQGQIPRIVNREYGGDDFEFPGSRARARYQSAIGIQSRSLVPSLLQALRTNLVVPANAENFAQVANQAIHFVANQTIQQ